MSDLDNWIVNITYQAARDAFKRQTNIILLALKN